MSIVEGSKGTVMTDKDGHLSLATIKVRPDKIWYIGDQVNIYKSSHNQWNQIVVGSGPFDLIDVSCDGKRFVICHE